VSKRFALAGALVVTLLAPILAAAPDRLATEIARWSSLLASDTRTDPLWLEATKDSKTLLTQVEEELRQGRRLVALERLAALGQNLAAVLYVTGRPAEERKNLAAFEAEWKRMGTVLRDVVSPGGRVPQSLETVRPAIVRALAELSISQARESYAASLAYGRNTEPQYGLYYLGAAQAQRAFLDIARDVAEPSAVRVPQLRTLRSEIDALQAVLLAAYRPPASIERHSEFIVASSALKEAREQDAAGHRYAALLRYLQSAQRVTMLRQPASTDTDAVRRRLEELSVRLDGGGTDHSVGKFFVERARSALASTPGATGEATAAAVANEVLPRYFAALEPAGPVAPAQQAQVTVTLVRWPFT